MKDHNDMPKILVIEDEMTLANNLSDKLKGEGYSVTLSGDGEDGLAKVRQEHPDLVVLDIMLPGLDGLSLCRIIRRDPDSEVRGLRQLIGEEIIFSADVGIPGDSGCRVRLSRGNGIMRA